MFMRIRWFALGVLSAVGGSAYVFVKLRQLRARLTPANLRRVGGHAVADALGAAARRISPDGLDQAAS